MFEKEGNASHPCPGDSTLKFTAQLWISFEEAQQMDILMQYRLAYCGIGEVNWCEALGTVLANDEVINGVSERGGFPVVKKNSASGTCALLNMPTASWKASNRLILAMP
ncbi:hypothetical protein [Paraflavitalea speifideaquila]|uniref:hypothetical protein n=1 Tax=Paraflavitalea speifideaquila TaxID=3076558 RepID=UPI0028E9BFE5|nr:hypothetical protein [Paraflavitalea speifideiaquila]